MSYQNNNTEPADDNVVAIADARNRRSTEPLPSCEEIREWRECKAELKRMLAEWQELGPQVRQMIPEWQKVRTNCTLASKILNGG